MANDMKNRPHTLIIDYADTEQRYVFDNYANAAQAWKLCDYEIRTYKDAAHMFSAKVEDESGKRVLYCEQEA